MCSKSQFVLLLVFVAHFTESQNITQYIQEFTKEIKSLFCNGLSIGGDKCNNEIYGIQDFMDSFYDYFDDEIEDTTIIQQIIDRLDKKLNLRASFLKNMTAKIEQSCIKYGYNYESHIETIPDFDELKFSGNTEREANPPDDIAFNPVYGNSVSLSESTYKLPNGVDYTSENIHKDAQISMLLEDTMIDLYGTYCMDVKGNEDYCNMYFGTVNGVFRQYPGVENERDEAGEYSNYDPRFRSWYVSAATGSKDVVILIDRSHSMEDHKRLVLAKQAVISVLKTLGPSSYVSVVAFNAKSYLSCFDDELIPATKRNVDVLIDFVTDLRADGGTNFTAPFDTAFNILDKGAKRCQTFILFLTDGIAPDVSHMIEERNINNAVVFSYTLGDESSPDAPRKAAKITNGIYTHIDDEDTNLINIMSSYYLYYAYGSHEGNNIKMTSPYLDFDTKLPMITMSMPVYSNDTYFVGVVGIDIPLSFLSEAIGEIIIGRKSYSFVVNQESEVILHPAIKDPLSTLFTKSEEYKAVYITDLEPKELNITLLTTRQNGIVKIEALKKQSAGNVVYNGYIFEKVNLLYVYSGVGPSSLSVAVVVYTDADIDAPNVKGFGFKSSPNTNCNDNSSRPANCLASFNMNDDLSVMKECNVSWINDAAIIDSSNVDGYEWLKSYVSFKHPVWYLQAGGWENSVDAIYSQPTCSSIETLHKLTNRLDTVSSDELPFGGFRSEISSKILNSIYIMSSLAKFWKSSYLEPNSTFFGFYFGSYQGLSIKYPAQKYKRTFNALMRPWYQRAISYPDLMVFTTPYNDATTGVLVASGATAIIAPNSVYPFGVAGFDYQFNEFILYWNNIMSDICNKELKRRYCYLIDSSAFLLYYDSIEQHVNHETISIKFLGDFEPTIMQSLIDRGFVEKKNNTNFMDDTIDISYITNNDIYYQQKLNTIPTSFKRNTGLYTVHMISKTNLYVVYIENYQQIDIYPDNCPNNVDCSDVLQPGCVQYEGLSQCVSATIGACIEPDSIETTTAITDTICSSTSEIDTFAICVLITGQQSDICASNFNDNTCHSNTKSSGLSKTEKIIIGCVIGGVAFLCIVGYIFYWWWKHGQQHNYHQAAGTAPVI